MIARASCAAMRNLVTGRVTPQPATRVTAKPPGPALGMGMDLGTGLEQGMGSDLGVGADNRRVGDSTVVANAATFEPFSRPIAFERLESQTCTESPAPRCLASGSHKRLMSSSKVGGAIS